jgi:hypothetical protein
MLHLCVRNFNLRMGFLQNYRKTDKIMTDLGIFAQK